MKQATMDEEVNDVVIPPQPRRGPSDDTGKGNVLRSLVKGCKAPDPLPSSVCGGSIEFTGTCTYRIAVRALLLPGNTHKCTPYLKVDTCSWSSFEESEERRWVVQIPHGAHRLQFVRAFIVSLLVLVASNGGIRAAGVTSYGDPLLWDFCDSASLTCHQRHRVGSPRKMPRKQFTPQR